MHVHSFLPILGLTLATIASAQDNSTQIPVVQAGAVNPVANTKRSLIPASAARRNVGKRAQNGICDALPSKWSYMGCFSDSPSDRVLAGASECLDTNGPDGMTQEKCIEYCDQKGYSLAGVEWGQECYCGYALDSSSIKAAESDCSKPCTGNTAEVCGEGGRINVFTNGDTAPAILAATGDFTSIGCYSDSASARTLTTSVSLPGNVRVSDCTTACEAKGFQYAGLEFGGECYCGASIQNGGAPIADSKCNMACSADKTQYCGGAGAINIYKSNQPQQGPSTIPDGWSSKNCYTDSPSNRALSYQIPNFSSFSNAQCISECSSRGYSLAGSEYGSECYCGNTIDNGNSPATSGCDMACNGNHADTCGGAGRINIFTNACSGTPGCHYGYGLIREIDYISTHDCMAQCHADPECQSIQTGTEHLSGDLVFCNLFKYPVAVVRAQGYDNDARCNSFTLYESSCAL
ncbi:uncharacterized protein HMPREF1541_02758 [Cyphellophora europaea CBS 101466]|uniref:WSC domain-containing protein n=1 Tax=Cyphellophora europaea (strain CBS 101466) TaxID=1220924 RepID=W2S6P0_CYPE1|nr:uncharacterized protein HMPREF1541_02758 [Cyphellophora europaea CBS 101466]ETN43599.1 hypothetical protein HMPREF1541_02758 [Cyphellophora europaea CBS 101466]